VLTSTSLTADIFPPVDPQGMHLKKKTPCNILQRFNANTPAYTAILTVVLFLQNKSLPACTSKHLPLPYTPCVSGGGVTFLNGYVSLLPLGTLRCWLFGNITITCSISHSPSSEADSHSSTQDILAFYGTRRSLPCSQKPTTFPSPELHQSGPCSPDRLLNLILSSHLRLGLTSGLFPLRFPHQYPVCTSPLHNTCYMPSPSHSS